MNAFSDVVAVDMVDRDTLGVTLTLMMCHFGIVMWLRTILTKHIVHFSLRHVSDYFSSFTIIEIPGSLSLSMENRIDSKETN